MSSSTLLIWDEVLTSYDHGEGHPLRPVRLDLTMELSRQLGVLDQPGVSIVAPSSADDEMLGLVHDPAYVAYVRAAPRAARQAAFARLGQHFGFGTDDNPVFDRMHEASALVAGASAQAARAVWEGTAEHAVNIAGGLHHAMRSRASGFCVYDDPAVGIAWLLAAGAQRVAYVDVDVHHGDGVQDAFYGDPRVLTISLHESGRTLFPGTGWPDEIGLGEGTGYAANVGLPAGTSDAGWSRAFEAVVPDLLRAYAPQVLVTQHGCDTHRLDPLAHLSCTIDGQRATYRRLHELAHEACGGKWVVLGGGGYEVLQVVPRAWTGLLAEVTGAPLADAMPDQWRAFAADRVGGRPPTSMTDLQDPAWAARPAAAWTGLDGSTLDRAIAATRAAVFPHHRLEA